MNFTFKKKQYTESATPEEVAALKDRILIYDSEIIFYDEVPVISPFSVEVTFCETRRLIEEFGCKGLIINLVNSSLPDAESRRIIHQNFGDVCDLIQHAAFVFDKSLFFNAVIKFVMFQTNLNSYSVHSTNEEAIEYTKKILNE